MKKNPPRLAQHFFRFYCRNHLRDSILGDLEEKFYQHQQSHGTFRARLFYWLNVLRFINRFTLKRNRNSISYNYYSSSMFKTNLISSFRFFSRNKSFAFINIFGLAFSLSSFLLILFFVNHELSYDEFHENKEQVYRINFSYADNSGNVTTLVNSPPALAEGISGKFPELEKISRMRYTMNCLLSAGEVNFYEDGGYYADSLFLEILKFDLTAGDPESALDQPNSIVITEEMALKYFNSPSPIGATLMFNNSTPLKVTGILSEVPANSHLDFDFLISFSSYTIPEGYASDLTSWSWLGFLTYVELKPASDPEQFEQKLTQHFKDLNPADPNPMMPIVQNLSDIYLGSGRMVDDTGSHIRSGNKFSINALMMIAALILVVAGFNFSILTNALSINRSKSTGIKKVLGASKKSIITQLVTESMILVTFCMLLSCVIVLLVFPAISSFIGWEFTPGFRDVWKAAPIVILAVIIIGTFSGLYPATVLASFDIIKSLKGSLKVGSRNPFQMKNALVMLQFAVSIGLIASTIIMTRQINYLRNKDTGYSTKNVMMIKMLPEDLSRYYELYKEQMTQNPSVINVSRSDRPVGEPWPWSVIQRADQGPEMSKRVFFNLADYGYFETMDIPLIEGRDLSREYVNDPSHSIIVNQKAAEYLGLEDPVGKKVYFFGSEHPRTIVGVAKDFNYTSLHEEIGPAVMILPFIDLEYMYVRFAAGELNRHIDILEDTWNEISESAPMEWRFLDDKLEQLYRSEEKLSAMIQFFAVLAVLLACLGLYGIITFMVNNRIKEVGVRKVLGASVQSIYTLFIQKYLYQVLLAMIIIAPLIHYLLQGWLQDFAYHIHINWMIYPLSGLLLILMILITVTYQIVKAAMVNPATLLRSE
ncbi:ABC transporter permease [Ekhidna sp.]|uniref:ABC transporter permease n=1 Tax=Ekhidna sp. TaxID=2608089 RepID=UPI003BABDC8C